jgi:CHAT domain-containing protein
LQSLLDAIASCDGQEVALVSHCDAACTARGLAGECRAMLAMIDKGKPHEAHPAYWAPFIVVGEGAAR